MKKDLLNTLKILIAAIILSFSVSAVYAWVAPTVAPPGGNVAAPVNVGTSTQDKNGVFRANGLRSFDNLIVDGNVGIGTSNPQAALDVNGDVIASGLVKADDIQAVNNIFAKGARFSDTVAAKSLYLDPSGTITLGGVARSSWDSIAGGGAERNGWCIRNRDPGYDAWGAGLCSGSSNKPFVCRNGTVKVETMFYDNGNDTFAYFLCVKQTAIAGNSSNGGNGSSGLNLPLPPLPPTPGVSLPGF